MKLLCSKGNWMGEKLQLALIDLIDAHEIFRTVFKEDDNGEVRQFVRKTEEFNFGLETVDLKEDTPSEEQLQELILDEIKVVFKLSTGPLTKCKLYQVSENKWVCLFVIHHIICDSRSFDVLKRDLLLAYNARVNNNSKGIMPLDIQYKDFAVWRDANLKGQGLKPKKNIG